MALYVAPTAAQLVEVVHDPEAAVPVLIGGLRHLPDPLSYVAWAPGPLEVVELKPNLQIWASLSCLKKLRLSCIISLMGSP